MMLKFLNTCLHLAQVICHFFMCQFSPRLQAMLGGSAWETVSMDYNSTDSWEVETGMYFEMYTRMLDHVSPERRMATLLGSNYGISKSVIYCSNCSG